MQNWDRQHPRRATRQAYLAKGTAHLRRDPVMRRLVEAYPPPEPRDHRDLFVDLIDAIISQQLSVKAAAAIFARVEALFDGDGGASAGAAPAGITPAELAAVDPEALRAAGLSRPKVGYVQGIAEAVRAGEFDPAALAGLDDEEVVAELVRLKGVGRWTAEMLLIFSLGRPDVFSVGDLGLRSAVARHYGVDRESHEDVVAVADRWAPYRSLACHYLWKSLENEPLS